MHIRKLIALLSVPAVHLVALSGYSQVTETYTLSPGATIPDGLGDSGVGDPATSVGPALTSTITVPIGTTITSISHVNVLLNLDPIVGTRIDGTTEDNGWNGDIMVTLTHGGQMAVLLNRTGAGVNRVTSVANGVAAGADRPFGGGVGGNTSAELSPDNFFNYGYSDNGFGSGGTLVFSSPNAFVFDDSATTDAHHYREALTDNATSLALGTKPTGRFQPDGRIANLTGSVSETDPRTALLSVFNGQNASGDWILSISDANQYDQQVLTSWGLELEAVPEPSTYAICFGSACLVGALGLRWSRRTKSA